MATLNINVRAYPLQAFTDTYITTNTSTPQTIDILLNDYLGVFPTIIDDLDLTGFTLGDVVTSVGDEITFTPNGNLGTSYFKYTIKDSIDRTSTADVIITTMLP